MKQKNSLPDGIAVYGGLTLLLLLGVAAFLFPTDFSVWERRVLAEAPSNYAIVDWTIEIENPAASERTLFVCKDSFANCVLPFLTANYSRIVAADARYLSGTLNEALEAAGDVDEVLFIYSLDSLATDTSILRKIKR